MPPIHHGAYSNAEETEVDTGAIYWKRRVEKKMRKNNRKGRLLRQWRSVRILETRHIYDRQGQMEYFLASRRIIAKPQHAPIF